MPVATVLLVATGLVPVEKLRKNRGYVLLGIFIVAAFLTPPDAISQTFMAVPMYVLYELGILLAVFLGRQRERDRAQEPATPSGD
jgi:sec-independent protein translocase protein TatC